VKNIPQTLILLKACLVPGTYLMKINETTMQILPLKKDTALQSSKKKKFPLSTVGLADEPLLQVSVCISQCCRSCSLQTCTQYC